MRHMMLILCVLFLAACEPTQPTPSDTLPTLFALPTEAGVSTLPPAIDTTPIAVMNETQIAALSFTQTALAATVAAPVSPVTAEAQASSAPVTTATATHESTIAAQVSAVAPLTFTPSLTITNTATRTPTVTPVSTGEQLSPLFQLAIMALSSTPAPTGEYIFPTATLAAVATLPPSNPGGILCMPPPGGFANVYSSDSVLAAQIGCPLGSPFSYASATQRFERGTMVYVGTSPAAIYVFYDSGTYAHFVDTFQDGVDPASGGEIPPGGLLEPVRGFGKVWRSDLNVRNGLGWATQPEAGATSSLLQFQNGQMISLPTLGQVAVLTTIGTFRFIAGSA